MIKTSSGRCQLTFKNGYTISFINGYGSYSENHFNQDLRESFEKNIECTSKDCEVAVLYDDMFCTDSFIETDDSVKGYITSNELADLIYKVKNK